MSRVATRSTRILRDIVDFRWVWVLFSGICGAFFVVTILQGDTDWGWLHAAASQALIAFLAWSVHLEQHRREP